MDTPTRRRGRGRRPWLLLLKYLGLVGFLGGLAALAAMGWLVPEPDSMVGWTTLRAAVRAVFFPCLFAGLVVTIVAGLALYLQHPRIFAAQRWFRLKVVLLAVSIPVLHFWTRGRMLDVDAALAAEDLPAIADAWRRVSIAFAVGFFAMLPIGAIGRIKPRLGEAPGSRAPRA